MKGTEITMGSIVLLVGLTLLLEGMVLAGETGPAGGDAVKDAARASSLPAYKPPRRGAPRGRIGGGTRGSSHEYPGVMVLAPDSVGLTAREQPVLFWHLDSATELPVEFTLIGHEGIQPLVEARLPKGLRAGMQRLALADFGARIAPGGDYQWFISVILDAEHPSRNIVSGGMIRRIELPAEAEKQMAQESGASLPVFYAENGLWYDALAAVQALLAANPEEPLFRKQQASLLSQAGLQLE